MKSSHAILCYKRSFIRKWTGYVYSWSLERSLHSLDSGLNCMRATYDFFDLETLMLPGVQDNISVWMSNKSYFARWSANNCFVIHVPFATDTRIIRFNVAKLFDYFPLHHDWTKINQLWSSGQSIFGDQ